MWAAIEKSTFLQHYRYTCSIHLHLNLVVARGSNVFMGDDSNFQNKKIPRILLSGRREVDHALLPMWLIAI